MLVISLNRKDGAFKNGGKYFPLAMTQKQAFLHHLKNRDLDAIADILEEGVSYCGAAKSEFLKKLKVIFHIDEFYRPQGKLLIKPNHWRNDTYYMIFRDEMRPSKLVIEEEGQRIVAMHSWRVKETEEYIKERLSSLLFFGEDERINFKPSKSYLQKLSKCREFCAQLKNGPDKPHSIHDLKLWLYRARPLYGYTSEEFMMFKFRDFNNIFYSVDLLVSRLSMYEEIEPALKEYSMTANHDLAEWHSRYNTIYYRFTMGVDQELEIISREKSIVRHVFHKDMYFQDRVFIGIIQFNRIVCGF